METFVDYITRGKNSIILPLILLILSCIIFETTELDLSIQDLFFNKETQSWVFNHRDKGSIAVFLYYKAVKWFVILFAVALIAKTIRGIIKHTESRNRIMKMLYLIVVMATIPSTVGILKAMSNMPFPYKIERYGGNEPQRTLIEAFSGKPLPSGNKYKGWPGGHSTFGFCFLGLGFVFCDRKKRLNGFLFATALGFLIGICHTVDGNHFFSHNIASWLIGWFLAAIIFNLFFKSKAGKPEAGELESRKLES